MLDTNVIVDFLNVRQPFYQAARLLMIGGRVGEFDLWVTSSQFTDLVYLLSDGGKAARMPEVLERLRGLRTFVNVRPVDDGDVDRMLATSWHDLEDALLYQVAVRIKADFLVTRNGADFEGDLVRVVDCDGFFAALRDEQGLDYEEVALSGSV